MLQKFSSTHCGLVRVLAVFVVSCVLISCGGTKNPKRLLQFKLYPKDAFVLYLSEDWSMETTQEGKPIKLGGRSESAYKFDVISVDPEGNIEFKVTAQNIIHPSLMAPLGPTLKGEMFTMHMASDGSIIRLEEMDLLREHVSEKLDRMWQRTDDPNNPAEGLTEELESYKLGILEKLRDDNLKGLFEPLFRVWPSTPVTDGDTWQDDGVLDNVQFDGLYASPLFTVESWEKGEVTLSRTSDLATLESDPLKSLSGSTESEITIDGLNGMIKTIRATSGVEGTFKVKKEDEARDVVIKEELFAELLRL